MRGFTPFKCSPGHILIAPIDQDKKGFTLPDKEENRKGKVVAIGDPTLDTTGSVLNAPCKVGDVIYHSFQYEGDILLKGTKYKIIRFDEVLGIYGN